MKFYVFNPEHDMALASFSPHYKAPTEIIRMRNDLSGLSCWYAEEGDRVLVPNEAYRDAFQSQCLASGIVPQGTCITEGELITASASVDDSSFSCCPWGWDPAFVSGLKKEGVDCCLLPTSFELEQIRILSGRQQCVQVLADFAGLSGVCGMAQICPSLEAVRTFLETHDDVILKAPWSGSGRGLVRTSLSTWTPNLEGWVGRILRTQGAIMAEPIYNKVIDFAMEFHMSAEHQLSFAGYSLFETDSHGNYKENVLTSNECILKKLTAYVSMDLLEKIKKQLLISLKKILGADYVGYFGVDMMVCKSPHTSLTNSNSQQMDSCSFAADDERQHVGSGPFVVHPCVEINLRMNMGVVARLLYDRYVSPRSEGSYVVEHYMADGEAEAFDRRMRTAHPLRVGHGKIVAGYFPLTPVCPTTRYQCYILCHTLV